MWSVDRSVSENMGMLSVNYALVALSSLNAFMALRFVRPDHLQIPTLALAAALLAASVWLLLLLTWQSTTTRCTARCEVATQCIEAELPPTKPPNPSVIALRNMLRDKGYTPPSDDELLRHLEAARPSGSDAPLDVDAGFRRVVATEQWRSKRAAECGHSRKGGAAVGESAHAASPPRMSVRGCDRLGRPCLRLRVCEPLETFPDELVAILEAHFHGPSPPPHPQLCVIIDLSDMRVFTRPPLAAGFDLVRQLRAHYPQRATAIHIVLLPPFARWVVNAVCSLLDSRTAKKIIVHDAPVDGTILSLAAHFSPCELPRAYGGREEIDDELPDLLAEIPQRPPRPSASSPLDATRTGRRPERPAGGSSSPTGTGARSPTGTGARRGLFGTSRHGDSTGEAAEEEEGGEEVERGERCGERCGEEERRRCGERPSTSDGAHDGARLVWTVMSEDETVLVGKLRARLDADPEMAALPRSIYGDDELLRYLSDVKPQFDLSAAFESLRNSLRMRERTELPVEPSQIEAYREHVRVDGVARSGERAIILIMSRALQEELLQDPEPFLRAVVGILESVKAELFVPGAIESVQTIVQVERGFKLSLGSVPIAATQRLMSVVSDMYPSYTSRILVVNLPGYLAWFVKFIKGMLCEGSANKIELVTDYERLLDFYEESGLPEYYRSRKSITP